MLLMAALGVRAGFIVVNPNNEGCKALSPLIGFYVFGLTSVHKLAIQFRGRAPGRDPLMFSLCVKF